MSDTLEMPKASEILNGGEQTIDGVTTGFLFGGDADQKYIDQLLDYPETICHVPYDQVSIEAGFNARSFDTAASQEHVSEIAQSIAAKGVEVPVWARIEGNRIIVTDGEVRTRAVYKANEENEVVKTIPVLLSTNGNDPVARVEDLITKNSGTPLTRPEKVSVVQRLLQFGYSKPQVLDRLGFSRTEFAKLMILAEAPPDVFEAAKKGAITSDAVIKLMTSHREAPPEEISKIVEKAVKKAEKDAEAARAEGKTEKTGASAKATLSDVTAVVAEDEDDAKTPTYNKTTFLGALGMLYKSHSLLTQNKVKDAERSELAQGIVNFLESINVDINEPLPEPKRPLTEEEKAAKEAEKAAAKEAKEKERAEALAKKAEAQAIIEAKRKELEEAKLAAGIKPRAKKEKSEAAPSESGDIDDLPTETA